MKIEKIKRKIKNGLRTASLTGLAALMFAGCTKTEKFEGVILRQYYIPSTSAFVTNHYSAAVDAGKDTIIVNLYGSKATEAGLLYDKGDSVKVKVETITPTLFGKKSYYSMKKK